MKERRNIITVLIGFVLCIVKIPFSHAQNFPCDGSFFISLNNASSPTTFYNIISDDGSVLFDDLTVTNLFINAIGYNPIDQYIYAVNRNNNDIVRIFIDGSFEIVGQEPAVSAWLTGAGDCSKEGIYAVNERSSNTLYFYDVVGGFDPIGNVQLTWSPGSGNMGIADVDLDDIVFDPNNPDIMYSYQRNYNGTFDPEPVDSRGALLRINSDFDSPNFGMVDVVGIVPETIVRHIGAMFFDVEAKLYAYGAINVSPLSQNRLISIDTETAEASLVSIGPSASGNDGCSCPFAVELNKAVINVDVACDSTTVLYEVQIINNSVSDVSEVTFIDELEFNGIITDVFPENPLGGNIESGTGIWFDQLTINEISISQEASGSFFIEVKLPTVEGSYSNQAILNQLPSLLGESILSDDPNSDALDDPTVFSIDTTGVFEISSFTIDTTICNGLSIFLNGNVYSVSGSFTEILSGAAVGGCDSLVFLNLTVTDDVVEGLFSAQICANDSILFNGTYYDESGIYIDTLFGAALNGCDSIIIFDLTLTDTVVGYETVSICEGDTITIAGQSITEQGMYEFFFTHGASAGCDSLLLLELITLENQGEAFISFTICSNDSVEVNNNFYSAPGTYSTIIENGAFNGCDSLIIIELVVADTLFGYELIELCQGDTLDVLGDFITEEGVYDVFYEEGSLAGCDSISTIEVLVESTPEVFVSVQNTDCTNIFGSISIDSVVGVSSPFLFSIDQENFQSAFLFDGLLPADYLLTLQSITGCETEAGVYSVQDFGQAVNLFAEETNLVWELGMENQLEVLADFLVDSVAWVPADGLSCMDCLNPVLTPLSNVSYTITAFDAFGCSASLDFNIQITKTVTLFVPNAFSPNGDGINDIFSIYGSKTIDEILEFRIFSRWGEEIYNAFNFSPDDPTVFWDGDFREKKMKNGVYTYFLIARCINDQIIYKEGDITLVR